MVMMCESEVALMTSSIEASVVVLPEPVGTGDKNEPARQREERLDRSRQPDFLKRAHVPRNEAQDDADVPFLAINAHPKTILLTKRKSEIDAPLLVHALEVLLARHGARERFGVFRSERRASRV